MQMIIIYGHLCPLSSPVPRKERKKVKTTPARQFQVGYIHNQSSIKTIIFFCGYKNRPNTQQQRLELLKVHCI